MAIASFPPDSGWTPLPILGSATRGSDGEGGGKLQWPQPVPSSPSSPTTSNGGHERAAMKNARGAKSPLAFAPRELGFSGGDESPGGDVCVVTAANGSSEPVSSSVGAIINATQSAFAQVSSPTAASRACITLAESRAERAELELVRTQVNLAHAQARHKDANQLLERLSTQNAELRSQLAAAMETVEELMRHREECELKHGWMLSAAASITTVKNVPTPTTAASVDGDGSLELRLEAALSESEFRRKRCVELEAALAESDAQSDTWKRRCLELEGHLGSSPSTTSRTRAAANSPSLVSRELATRKVQHGTQTFGADPAVQIHPSKASSATPPQCVTCQALSEKLQANSSAQVASSVEFKRVREHDAANLKLALAEKDVLQYKVGQLERELQGEKRLCGELRTRLDRQDSVVWEAARECEQRAQALAAREVSLAQKQQEGVVAAARIAGETHARRQSQLELNSMRSELSEWQASSQSASRASSSAACVAPPKEEHVPASPCRGAQERTSSAVRRALERTTMRSKPSDESRGAIQSEASSDTAGGAENQEEMSALMVQLQSSREEIDRLQKQSQALSERRRQWESQCARREAELEEAKVQLAHLRVKCGTAWDEDPAQARSTSSEGDRTATSAKLKSEEVRREAAEQVASHLRAQHERVHKMLLDAATGVGRPCSGSSDNSRQDSNASLEKLAERIVQQLSSLESSTADLRAQFDSSAVAEDIARAELLEAQDQVQRLKQAEFSYRDRACREEDAARTIREALGSEIEELRNALASEENEVSQLRSEMSSASAGGMKSQVRARQRLQERRPEEVALRQELQRAQLSLQATREELAEVRNFSNVRTSTGSRPSFGSRVSVGDTPSRASLGEADSRASVAETVDFSVTSSGREEAQDVEETQALSIDAAAARSGMFGGAPAESWDEGPDSPSTAETPHIGSQCSSPPIEEPLTDFQRRQNLHLPLQLPPLGRLSFGTIGADDSNNDGSLGFSPSNGTSRSNASLEEDAPEAGGRCSGGGGSPTNFADTSSTGLGESQPSRVAPLVAAASSNPRVAPPAAQEKASCVVSRRRTSSQSRSRSSSRSTGSGVGGASSQPSKSNEKRRSSQSPPRVVDSPPTRTKELSPPRGNAEKSPGGQRRSASSNSPPNRSPSGIPGAARGQLQAAAASAQQRRAASVAAAAADRAVASERSSPTSSGAKSPSRMASSPPKQRPFV